MDQERIYSNILNGVPLENKNSYNYCCNDRFDHSDSWILVYREKVFDLETEIKQTNNSENITILPKL